MHFDCSSLDRRQPISWRVRRISCDGLSAPFNVAAFCVFFERIAKVRWMLAWGLWIGKRACESASGRPASNVVPIQTWAARPLRHGPTAGPGVAWKSVGFSHRLLVMDWGPTHALQDFAASLRRPRAARTENSRTCRCVSRRRRWSSVVVNSTLSNWSFRNELDSHRCRHACGGSLRT